MKIEILIIIAGSCICSIVIIAIGIWLVFFTGPSLEVKVAQQKCIEYAKVACDNPHPNQTNLSSDDDELADIRGGMPAVEGMFPHMAFLHTEGYCGGTLISEYFVMTAAHCATGVRSENMKIIMGTIDRSIGERPNPEPGIVYKVEKIFLHTSYDPKDDKTWDNDIALLKLATKVEFDWKKRPICLNTDFSSVDSKNITASGWGTDENGEMRKTVLQVVDQDTEGAYQRSCRFEYERTGLSFICAANEDPHQSVCQGDSGGPLQIPLKTKNACPNTYEQLGIVAHGLTNCTNDTNEPRMVLYTRVDQFIEWIVPHVWPNELEDMRN